MMWHTVYKIVDDTGDKTSFGEPIYRTLFHGRSERLAANHAWHTARNAWVRDGSGDAYYWSGWHVFESREVAQEYLLKVDKEGKRNAVIVECWADWLATKPTNREVSLARAIAIKPSERK